MKKEINKDQLVIDEAYKEGFDEGVLYSAKVLRQLPGVPVGIINQGLKKIIENLKKREKQDW